MRVVRSPTEILGRTPLAYPRPFSALGPNLSFAGWGETSCVTPQFRDFTATMKPSSIEQMWERYRTAAGLAGPDVSAARLEEARRAFFGGLLDMFAALGEVSELSESEAEETLDGWQEEFTAYATGLAQGLIPQPEQ